MVNRQGWVRELDAELAQEEMIEAGIREAGKLCLVSEIQRTRGQTAHGDIDRVSRATQGLFEATEEMQKANDSGTLRYVIGGVVPLECHLAEIVICALALGAGEGINVGAVVLDRLQRRNVGC